jgi:hypothetical protein
LRTEEFFGAFELGGRRHPSLRLHDGVGLAGGALGRHLWMRGKSEGTENGMSDADRIDAVMSRTGWMPGMTRMMIQTKMTPRHLSDVLKVETAIDSMHTLHIGISHGASF